jgi:hypothetical protein
VGEIVADTVFIEEGTACAECGFEITRQEEFPISVFDEDNDRNLDYHAVCVPVHVLIAMMEAALGG